MTTASPRPFPWGFLLKWIAASAIGLAGGQMLGALPALLIGGLVAQAAGELIGALVVFAVQGALTGAALGFSQQVLMRNELALPARWILLSALGWGIGFVSASLSTSATGQALDAWLSSLVSWALIGASIGVAQHVWLRDQVERATWWIAGNIVSWVLGPPLAAMGISVLVSLGLNPNDSTGALVSSALIGAVGGAFTGLALIWLLRNPIEDQS